MTIQSFKPIRSVAAVLLIAVLLVAPFPLGALGSQAVAQEPRSWHVDDDLADYPDADFTKIQDAVDAASAGHTIIVYPGTYTENIGVNKDNLTIQSKNRADSSIVQAANPGDHVFEVTADYVNISGFTVKGATYRAGIYLDSEDYCELSNNKLSSNNYGISTHTYWSSANNVIRDNIFEDNDRGIFVSYGSGSNSITRNICKNNNAGFFLAGGNNAVTSSYCKLWKWRVS